MAGTFRPGERNKNTPDEHPTETPQSFDQDSPDSGRFAPFVGADSVDQEHSDNNSPIGLVDEDWRAQDRESFNTLVGERVRAFGEGWNPGIYAGHLFYNPLRKQAKPKPLVWPGRFLEDLFAKRGEEGVGDWLIEQGLERVDAERAAA